MAAPIFHVLGSQTLGSHLILVRCSLQAAKSLANAFGSTIEIYQDHNTTPSHHLPGYQPLPRQHHLSPYDYRATSLSSPSLICHPQGAPISCGRLCLSNKFPGDGGVVGLGSALGKIAELDFHVLKWGSGHDILSGIKASYRD